MSKKHPKKIRKYTKTKVLKKHKSKFLVVFLIVIFFIMISPLIKVRLPALTTIKILGNQTLVITLYKVSKVEPQLTILNNEVTVIVGNKSITFLIPNISKSIELIKENKSLIINEKVQNLKTYLKIGNTIFPGPEINPSLYEEQDYILTYFPYEIHFIFSNMLCNASFEVTSERFLRIDEIIVKSSSNKAYVSINKCHNSTCFLKLNVCLLKPDVEVYLTAFNLIKIRSTLKESYLDLKDNLWLPIVLGMVVVVLTAYRVGYVKLALKLTRKPKL